MIIIYSTFPTKGEAEKIGQGLVCAKLAACINIFKIDSIYQCQGRIEKSREYAAFIKTKDRKFKQVKGFILKHHSYEVPCVLELPAGKVAEEYQNWAQERIVKN